jgi:hypothetical protein
MTESKRTNIDLQNTKHKTKIEQHEPHETSGMSLSTQEG